MVGIRLIYDCTQVIMSQIHTTQMQEAISFIAKTFNHFAVQE